MQNKPTPVALKYDRQIALARGSSRKELRWVNLQIPWSQLLAKLAMTTRTPESQAEYFAASKAVQDEIKDVGGFVGGTLAGGRRKAECVSFRTLVTLDADFATPGLHDKVLQLADFAMAVYSTHKHTPEKPRLRFLIPLARPVTAEEYKAVSRRLAADIGIDLFDDTTYDPSRLMYWPSTSRDAEYIFDYVDAPFADPDTLLATYTDWHDATQWPASERAGQEKQKLAERQGDPLTKPGMVGAFCRAYSIEKAIETFLPDIYEPCDIPNRYTYTKGSTVAGVVVYDDKFSYSHHGTDPASERLLNAFDMVRVHKFGERDKDAPASSPPGKLPSWKAMLDLCTNDAGVREMLAAEQLEAAKAEFGDAPDAMVETDARWRSKLVYDGNGKIKETINNAVLMLENDPRLAGRIGFNCFANRAVVMAPLPWNNKVGAAWTDADDAALRHYLEFTYKLGVGTKITDALAVVLERHAFHPVRDYLDALVWDGTPRVETMLIDYLGAEDCAYVRACTKKTLEAAVARVRDPGCKFDTMLVLVGAQGTGKSQLVDRLGREWYSDSLPNVTGKDAYEALQGYWLIEMAELTAAKQAEVEAVKHFISKREDVFRMAYGRRTTPFPRQCIFIGTTNNPDFLRDRTGNRRFWPVDIKPRNAPLSIWKHMTPEIVDQLWAEADRIYKKSEPLYLDDAAVAAEAMARQEQHTEDSTRGGIIRGYLERELPVDWNERDQIQRRDWLNGYEDPASVATKPRDRVCVLEIWVEALGGDPKVLTAPQTRELHEIMMSMKGWAKYDRAGGKLKFPIYGVQRAYIRNDDDLLS